MGMLLGMFLGIVDASAASQPILPAVVNWGSLISVIGLAMGFVEQTTITFVSPRIQATLLVATSIAMVGLGFWVAYSSFAIGLIAQGSIRIFLSSLAATSVHFVPILALRKPVNIGGEGEIPKVLNLQGYWVTRDGFRCSRNGDSICKRMVASDVFVFYDASRGVLPFPSNSVPTVYTNSVPIDAFGASSAGIFPPIKESEIMRILRRDGRWIHDGKLVAFKP